MRVIYIIIRNIVSYILFESNYSNIVYFFECFVSAFYKDFSYYVSLRTLFFLYYSLYLLFIHFFSFLTFSQIHSCVMMHIWLTFIFTFLFKVGYNVHGIIIVFMILFIDDLLLPVKVYNWKRNVYLYIGQICFFGKMWKLSYRLFFIWEICLTSQNIWKGVLYIQLRKGIIY